MSILSLEFIALTLATVIVYYIVPLKVRWCVLLAASAVFYAMAGWQSCVWIVLVTAITFFASLLQHRLYRKEKQIAAIEEERYERSQQGEGIRSEENAEAGQTGPEQQQAGSLPEKGWFSSSARTKKLRKLVLAATIILPFASMAFVKYYDAFRSWITTMPALTLIVPLGLSYFTFQSVGYTVDIYRGKYEPARNPLKYLLFTSFYPLLTQGPISP